MGLPKEDDDAWTLWSELFSVSVQSGLIEIISGDYLMSA